MAVATELAAVARMRGASVSEVMADPQRLAWDASSLRAERELRRIRADLIIASADAEAMGVDVLIRLIREIFVEGLRG
jgi:hypothetical protein